MFLDLAGFGGVAFLVESVIRVFPRASEASSVALFLRLVACIEPREKPRRTLLSARLPDVSTPTPIHVIGMRVSPDFVVFSLILVA